MTPSGKDAPRIAVLRGFWEERADGEIGHHVDTVAASLAKAGAFMSDVEAGFSIDDVQAINQPILRFEAAQYHRPNFDKHAGDYGPGIRRLIESGLKTSEQEYEAARARQREFGRTLGALLAGVDALLLPVAPSTAPKGLQSTGDPAFCAPASTSGLPSIALPSGIGEGGMPLAVQLVGRAFEEPALLNAAAWVEARLGFNSRPAI